MGSLVMVGVGPLQSLACTIFTRGLPCDSKTGCEHWEKLVGAYRLFAVGLEIFAVGHTNTLHASRIFSN